MRKGVYVYRNGRVGKIYNVSGGGILCTCIHGSMCDTSVPEIFCPGNSVCLSGIPFQVISSIVGTDEVSPLINLRKCHVKFEPLTKEKVNELELFIDNYSLRNKTP